MTMRQGQEDENLPSVDGELVLDDLQLYEPDHAVSPAPGTIPAVAEALNEIRPAMETARRQGSKRAAALLEGLTLSKLVDQWIEADKEWQSNQKAQPKLDGPEELKRKRDVHRLTWCSPQYETSIFQTLTAFWERNPPKAIVGGDGRLTISAEPRLLLNREGLRQDAQTRAIWTFQRLLQSPERDLLSRCDGCKRFLVRARAPRRGISVEHGTFCLKCKGLGGARRTVASRERRKRQMIESAAELWPKWKPKAKYGKRSKWVAEMMNRKQCTSRTLITGKWVTQNQPEIEAEAEGRNHAKS